MKKFVVGLFFLLAIVGTEELLAQNLLDKNWYFGDSSYGINFRRGDCEPELDSVQFTPFGSAGSAVLSDQINGNLRFYTDGTQVIDHTHSPMPNGNLAGDSDFNQAAALSPVPGLGNRSRFYIFYQSTSEVLYSIADMELAGNASGAQPPQGDLENPKDNGTGISNPSGAMLVVPSDTSTLYWLIAFDAGNSSIEVMEISEGNFGAIQSFSLSALGSPVYEAAHFSYHRPSGKIAISPKNNNRNIGLFDFDQATGTLSFDREILNTGVGNGGGEAIYSTEWSSNGSKLYYTISGLGTSAADLRQVSLNDTTDQISINSILENTPHRSYGLKRGPDDKIYHLFQATAGAAFELAVIHQPDTLATDFIDGDYEINPLGDANFESRQFPSFSPRYIKAFDNAAFVAIGDCEGNPTKFFPTVEPPGDNYFWDFGDGNTSNAFSPIHLYETGGQFLVELTISFNGVVDTVSSMVNIQQNQLEVDLGNDTTICRGEVLTLDAGPGGVSYNWSTGESGQSIQVDSAGYYWVSVQTPGGCFLYDGIEVTVYGEMEQRANQWYFGQQAGIDFNEQPPVAITDNNQMFSPEGAATISDQNGDLLFYTNGSTVWNREHEVMENGTNIGGDSTSTQSSLIVPIAEDETMFYLFTTEKIYGTYTYRLKYSVVDIKEDNGLGAVVVKDQVLFTKSTERITATRGDGANWLIAHEYGNNVFRAYPLTEEGIQRPVISQVGSIHSTTSAEAGQGYMKLSIDGSRLAVALPGNPNVVEFFDFDGGSGAITNPQRLSFDETLPDRVYGIEFSANAEKLYVSVNGGTSRLYQFDLDTTSLEAIQASQFLLAEESASFGALQAGPNGEIYLAIDGSGFLGTINNPNADEEEAGFVLEGFNLEGRTSRLGLPNFVQIYMNPPMSPQISASGFCVGQPTQFSGTGTDDIDEFFWNFGDGNTSSEQNPEHTYNEIGEYEVVLSITNRCGLDTTLTTRVEILDLPPDPDIEDEAAICDEDGVVLTAFSEDLPDLLYEWSTGETTREITVQSEGIYTVTITNLDSCSSGTREIFVGDGRPIVDLGENQTVCQFEDLPDLDARNAGASYEWTINGTASGQGRFQSIDTSEPGDFEYTVRVVDPVTECIRRESVLITVLPAPQFEVFAEETSACGESDGSLLIDLSSDGEYTYEITGSTNQSGTLIGPTTENIGNLAAGNYNLRIRNVVSGCEEEEFGLAVEDPVTVFELVEPFELSADCDQGELRAAIDFLGEPPFELNYVLTNTQSGEEIIGTTDGTEDEIFIDGLEEGNYRLRVIDATDPNGCSRASEVFEIEFPADTEFSLEEDFCHPEGTQITVSPTNNPDNTSYSWSPTQGIVSGANGPNPIFSQSGVYTLTIESDGFCPVEEEVVVDVFPTFSAEISTQGEACDGRIVLTADVIDGQADDNYSYQWPGSTNRSVTVTQSGTYSVTVRSQNTGCTATAEIEVDVDNPVSVRINAAPDCDRPNTLFLEAIPSREGNLSYTWFRDNSAIEGADSTLLEVTESAEYTVQVIDLDSGCEDFESFDVQIIPIEDDELELPRRIGFCPLDPEASSIELSPGSFSSYEWRRFGSEDIISNNAVLVVTEAGTYEVSVTNGIVCTRDTVTVFVDCNPRIEAPNAFTPNGDGLNDEFFVFPNDYVTDFQIFIYNRWGELIYQSDNRNFRWNGRYNGELVPLGKYAYRIRFRSVLTPEDGLLEQTGSVTILR